MCNLYRMTKNADEVARLFGAQLGSIGNAVEEVYPGYPGLVAAGGTLRSMTWGFPLVLKGKNGQPLKPKPVNNTRADKLDSFMWRFSFQERRCLIPVSEFAEAEGPKGSMTRTWFSLPDQDGKTHSLKDYAGQPLVLYFYPKDDTPGCTTEACAFRDNLPEFTKGRAAVFGISILDEKSKAKFAAKHDLNYPLLADADHAVAEKYGVWQEKSRYGRKYMGIVRTTYLIGPDGKVARRWDTVKVDGHAEEVLAAVREL